MTLIKLAYFIDIIKGSIHIPLIKQQVSAYSLEKVLGEVHGRGSVMAFKTVDFPEEISESCSVVACPLITNVIRKINCTVISYWWIILYAPDRNLFFFSFSQNSHAGLRCTTP